ncbi:hypothetical protein D3C84_1187410 [compost metagenome]
MIDVVLHGLAGSATAGQLAHRGGLEVNHAIAVEVGKAQAGTALKEQRQVVDDLHGLAAGAINDTDAIDSADVLACALVRVHAK